MMRRGRPAPVLVTGCQRSGTTLLALVLSVHPEIDVVDEDDPRFHEQGSISAELRAGAAVAFTLEQDGLVVFKCPRDTHRIDELATIAGARVIWLRRSVEAVVASMCRLHVGSEAHPWALTHGPREIAKYLQRFPSDDACRRSFAWALGQDDIRCRSLAVATVCWASKERTRSELLRSCPDAVLTLSYEDLVKSPASVLGRVCRWAGVPGSNVLLKHHTLLEGVRIGGTDAARPIDTGSLYRWREQLDGADLQLIQATLADFGMVMS